MDVLNKNINLKRKPKNKDSHVKNFNKQNFILSFSSNVTVETNKKTTYSWASAFITLFFVMATYFTTTMLIECVSQAVFYDVLDEVSGLFTLNSSQTTNLPTNAPWGDLKIFSSQEQPSSKSHLLVGVNQTISKIKIFDFIW